MTHRRLEDVPADAYGVDDVQSEERHPAHQEDRCVVITWKITRASTLNVGAVAITQLYRVKLF